MMRLSARWSDSDSIFTKLSLAHCVLISWIIFCGGFLLAPQKPALGLLMYWFLLTAVVWLAIQRPRINWNEPLLIATAILTLYFTTSVAWGVHNYPWPVLTPLKFSLSLLLFLIVTQALVRQWPQLPKLTLTSLSYLGMVVAMATIANYLYLLDSAQLHFLLKLPLAGITPHPVNSTTVLPRLNGLGNLRNPLVVSSVLGCCSLISTDQFYRAYNVYAKLFHIIAAVLCAAIVILSQSRSPFFLLLICYVAIAITHRTERRYNALLIALGCIIALPTLWSGFVILSQERGIDMSYRDLIWTQVCREMPGHWWFGHGLRKSWDIITPTGIYHHAHSVALELLRFGGIIGLSLFIHVIFRFLAQSKKAPSTISNILIIWLVFGLGCQLVNGSFPIGHPHYHWFLLWLPVALMASSATESVRASMLSPQKNHLNLPLQP